MGMTTWTAFQPTNSTQARALLVLGALDPEAIDDDFFFQIIVAFRGALSRLQESDDRVAVNLLHCVHKLTPALVRGTRSAPLILWSAACFLHTGMVSLFGESAHLLRVMLDSMYEIRNFDQYSLVDVFAEARQPVEEEVRQIDAAVGLSFSESNFSFSFATSIFRGIRYPETYDAAKQLLTTLLLLSARKSIHQDRQQPISPHAIGFFLALLPTVRTTEELDHLIRAAGGGSSWAWSAGGNPLRPRVPFAALGIQDENRALLVVTFLIGILETAPTTEEAEQEMMFDLLADASRTYPDIAALA